MPVNSSITGRVFCSCETGIVPTPNSEKENRHDQSNRFSDRRPVRNRRLCTNSSRFGFRLGFGRRLDAGSFGASRFGAGGQESRTLEGSQSQRIGFGFGGSVGASAGCSSAGSQQVSVVA